jgi:hypothetical protein
MKATGAPSKRWLCLGAALLREGRSGRLVWRANCPFETPIDSLSCSSNTVQNGSCREPSGASSPRAGFSLMGKHPAPAGCGFRMLALFEVVAQLTLGIASLLMRLDAGELKPDPTSVCGVLTSQVCVANHQRTADRWRDCADGCGGTFSTAPEVKPRHLRVCLAVKQTDAEMRPAPFDQNSFCAMRQRLSATTICVLSMSLASASVRPSGTRWKSLWFSVSCMPTVLKRRALPFMSTPRTVISH